MEQIDVQYAKAIYSSIKKLKVNSYNSIPEILSNIEFLYLENLDLPIINYAYKKLFIMEDLAKEINQMESLERPSLGFEEYLDRLSEVSKVKTIKVYVRHRIKNKVDIFGLKEYSDSYFASDYQYMPFLNQNEPIDRNEIVIEPLSTSEMEVGVMEFQVIPAGETTLYDDNGFEKKYPLYREVSDKYIENVYNAEVYYNSLIALPEYKESFNSYLKELRKVLKRKVQVPEVVEWEEIVPNRQQNTDQTITTVKEERVFGFVETTSELEQDGYDFNAYNLVDNNPKTIWVEGVSGLGENEVITFYNYKYDPNTINEIHITNGYNGESSEMYKKNARVKDIKIEFDNGVVLYETLKDTSDTQIIKLDQPISTGVVSITILSAYPGTQYEDTCISDIIFY